MKQTRFVTGLVLLTVVLIIAASGSPLAIDSLDKQESIKDEKVIAESGNAETVLMSFHNADKLTVNVLDTNTEESLPIGLQKKTETSSVIIESNDSVKTTKKKSNYKKKEKKEKKIKKKTGKKNKRLKSGYTSGGTYKITGYCSCASCCGKTTGITASGTKAKAGRTIAADTSVLPFGTKVIINGHTYTVEDRGGAIRGNKIDLYFSSHAKALEWGVRYVEVYVKK